MIEFLQFTGEACHAWDNCTQNDWFDKSRDFSHFLAQYISIVDQKKYEFANALCIHQTTLSRILNQKEDPNVELMYRLEKHSCEVITAMHWWKIVEKHTAYLIMTNSIDRKREWRKVKSHFKFNE